MSKFTFMFTLLEHGWAVAQVASENNTKPLSASYLSDALGDLARSVIRLFTATENETITCSWQEEPGEFRWLMRRDGGVVHLQIRLFQETFSRKSDEKGELWFSTECSFMRLATQVQSQMFHLLAACGEDGYLQRWMKYPFPLSEYKTLTTLIKVHTSSVDKPLEHLTMPRP